MGLPVLRFPALCPQPCLPEMRPSMAMTPLHQVKKTPKVSPLTHSSLFNGLTP